MRDRPGPDPVLVYYTKPDGSTQSIACDLVILAVPAPIALGLLGENASDEETRILSSLKPLTMVTHLVRAKDPRAAQHQSVISWPLGLTPSGSGHVFTIRDSAQSFCDVLNPHADMREYVTYQVFDVVEEDTRASDIQEHMLHDLKSAYGLTDVTVVTQRINRCVMFCLFCVCFDLFAQIFLSL